MLAAVAEGAEAAGRDADAIVRMIEVKVSYDHDAEYARDACRWWAALSLTPEEKTGVEDPVEMGGLADAAADRAHSRFIVSDDPEQVAAEIAPYTELGFTHPSSMRRARPAPLSTSSAPTSCHGSSAVGLRSRRRAAYRPCGGE